VAGSVYSSEPDLNLDADRLIELTDTSAAPGVKNQALVDSLSLEAQDDVDEVLTGVWVVPFNNTDNPVPAPIRRIHAARWRYLLFQHRDALNIPDSVVAQWKSEEEKLADYGTPGDGGRILIGAQMVSGAGADPKMGSFAADPDNTKPAARIFGRYRDTLG
jgi:hypothetical protein